MTGPKGNSDFYFKQKLIVCFGAKSVYDRFFLFAL